MNFNNKVIHVLKVKPTDLIYDIVSGAKTFEIRKNDRNFKVGDILYFIGVNEKGEQANVETAATVKYILENRSDYGLKDGYIAMSIESFMYSSDVFSAREEARSRNLIAPIFSDC